MTRLKEARRAAGFKTAIEFAAKHGFPQATYQHHENGTRGMKIDVCRRYARLLGVDETWLLTGNGAMHGGNPAQPSDELSTAQHQLRREGSPTDSPALDGGTATIPVLRSRVGVESPSVWPRKIPIRGYAKGGQKGFFFDNGSPIGMAPAPPQLQDVNGAYAVFVHDDSMEPRYFSGELAYVNPHKPVRPGDHVVIEMTDGQAFVKRLERRTQKTLTCKQYNPPKMLEYEASRVKSVHRVVLSGEDPT